MKKILLVILALLALASPVRAQVIPPSQTISVVDSGTQCSLAGTCAQWQIPNAAPSFTVQVTGTLTTVTLTFRGSADGVTFFDLLATKLSTGVQAATTTTTGQYAIVNPGIIALRVVGTVVTAGAANLTLTRGSASSSARAFPSFGSFATGDLLYASATNVVSGLADVAAGSYLRSGGVTTAPLWSTLTLPNAATTGDILTATAANTVGVVAAVASGQVLASAGTSTAPAYTATPSVTSITVRNGNGTTNTVAQGSPLISASSAAAAGLLANGATANSYTCYTVGTLPGNTLKKNGDHLLIEAMFQVSSSVQSKVYNVSLGGTCTNDASPATGMLFTNSSSLASTLIAAHTDIWYNSAGVQAGTRMSYVGANLQISGLPATASLDETNSLTIFIEVNSAGTSDTNAIVLRSVRVTYVPAP